MKLLRKNILTCEKIVFFSQRDEEAFFDWIKRIECINDFFLDRDILYLRLNKTRLSNIDLNNLIGVFYRYEIEMIQLARFLTKTNKNWFYDNKIAFWHKRVFKNKMKNINEFMLSA